MTIRNPIMLLSILILSVTDLKASHELDKRLEEMAASERLPRLIKKGEFREDIRLQGYDFSRETATIEAETALLPVVPGASLKIDRASNEAEIFDHVLSDAGRTTRKGKEKRTYVKITPKLKVVSFALKEGEDDSSIYDYYHFSAEGSLSSWGKKPIKYNLNFQVDYDPKRIPITDLDSILYLEAYTPTSGNNTTDVTTTIKVGFKPKVSLFPVGAEAEGEISWERTKARKINDMLEIGRPQDFMPGWTYKFTTKEATMSTGMQYDQEWVWRVNRQKAIASGVYRLVGEQYQLPLRRDLEAVYGKVFKGTQKHSTLFAVDAPKSVIPGKLIITFPQPKAAGEK